jgi:hypothetical protein
MCEKHEEDHSCCTVSAVCYQRVPTAVNSQLGQGPRSVVPTGATPHVHLHGTRTIRAVRACLPAATWNTLVHFQTWRRWTSSPVRDIPKGRTGCRPGERLWVESRVLRPRYELKPDQRQIAVAARFMSDSYTSDLKRADAVNVSWPRSDNSDEAGVKTALIQKPESGLKQKESPSELARIVPAPPHVTLQLLRQDIDRESKVSLCRACLS